MSAVLSSFLANTFLLYLIVIFIFSASNVTTCVVLATPPAQGTNDAAGPAAGAVLGPAAGPATVNPDLDHDPTHLLATANPGLGPRPGPSPVLPRPRRRRPNLNPGPDPGPRASPHPPRESLDQDLQARPSLMQRMEVEPQRSQHRSHSR